MINLSEVSKYYEDNVALKNINFSVEKGDMVYVTGPSGAGKTTLLRMIYRAECPDEGRIVVGGWDVGKLKQKTIPYLRRNVGIVFQDFRLLYNMTIFDNVALSLRIHSLHPKEITEDVTGTLKEVGLKHRAFDFPRQLSGGEQQRVVIARAIVSRPTVLLADEPTGNLDPETSKMVLRLFREINARGTTVIIATHNRDLFEGTGLRVTFLENGEIVRETTV